MPALKSFAIWWLTIPILTAAGQACMKLLALRMEEMEFGLGWFQHAAATPYFWAIFVIEIVNFIVWMRILATVDIAKAMPLSAIAYLLILLLGWFGFNEPVLWLQVVGSLFIMAGVVVIGSEKSKPVVLPPVVS